MRKIIQIVCGMFTELVDNNDDEIQEYNIIALCDDSTIWVHTATGGWINVDTSAITEYIKPHGPATK